VHITNYRQKSKAVFLFFFLFLFLCVARLFFIQVFRSSYLKGLAAKQHNLFVELEPLRGTIYDCNLKPLAINLPMDSLYANPNEIKDKKKALRALSNILNLEKSILRERLYRKKYFVWLERKISPQKREEIKKLNIKGLGFLKESKRSYPNGYLASHIIGFAGLDNTGLEGLESFYDKYLKGQPGWAVFLRDARQKKLDLYKSLVLPKDGYDIVLTIDEVIQYIAERELDKVFKNHNAKGASIIVMNPHTGAILALANRPTYDLNEYMKASKDYIRNRAICDLFEPGSIFKIITLASALEEGKVNEEDKFFCENGAYRVASHTLHDHRPHAWLTFREVIGVSSNIGTTKVAQILGPETIYRYIKLFGFAEKSGVDLPGEISGMAKEPKRWSKISIAAIPIGQEVGVTALQSVSAISVIANGGQLMQPYIIKEIRDRYAETIRKFSPALIRKAISLDTAERAKNVLIGVVEEGTGKLAKIQGIPVAGKTGTAQKLEPNGTYSHSRFVASFIGFAPADEPLIAISVIVDEPRPYYFGAVVAAPVFRNVAGEVIKYLKANQSAREFIALNENKTTD
jgi:cell division protein FtsI/penicillin-binding protein 2